MESWSWFYRTLRRDVQVLWHVFPWRAAGLLSAFVLLAAWGVQLTYNAHGPADARLSFVQAIYAVGMMLQLQFDLSAPPQLDPYLVLVPAIGLPLMLVFGLNLFQVLRIFFVREERGQLWQSALVSTLSAPIVVCGLGRVGYRVAQQLHTFHQRYPQLQPPVVGIDLTPSPLTERLIRAGVPVLYGDIRSEDVLRQAGVDRAQSVIVCTNQDVVNLDATLRIRELNPQARLVLRLFDDGLAPAVERAFGVARVISRSARAAAWFVESALGHGLLEEFPLTNEVWQVQRLSIAAGMPWVGMTPAAIEAHTAGLRVLVHARPGMRAAELSVPAPVQVGDDLYLLGPAQAFDAIPLKTAAADAPYLVGGLGHTGYRVALALRERGLAVVGIDERGTGLGERLREAGVRVLHGDFRLPAVLERAGVREAAALILCAEKDMLNFEAGLRARELNPSLRVVMRIFEDELGERLSRLFAFNDVHSTSAIAAPDFVAAALPSLPPFHPIIGLSGWYLVRINVPSTCDGVTLAEYAARRHLRVLVHRAGDRLLHVFPDEAASLQTGDELLVLVDEGHLLECMH